MKLPRVAHTILFPLAEEQISDLTFGYERLTQNVYDFKDISIQLKVVFDGSNIDLNPNRIFRVTPKGFDFQMLFEEF